MADDVNFAQSAVGGVSAELRCPAPGCTDPFLAAPDDRAPGRAGALLPGAQGPRPVLRLRPREHEPLARAAGRRPAARSRPRSRSTSPGLVRHGRPERGATLDDRAATVDARGGALHAAGCYVAPGSYPGDGRLRRRSPSGRTATAPTRSGAFDGVLARSRRRRRSRRCFPRGAGDFDGREPGARRRRPTAGGRTTSRTASSVKVDRRRHGDAASGQDRRQAYLHRDAGLLPTASRGSSRATARPRPCSPTSTATTATSWCSPTPTASSTPYERDGGELAGLAARGDRLPLPPGPRACAAGAVGRRPRRRCSPRPRSATSTATACRGRRRRPRGPRLRVRRRRRRCGWTLRDRPALRGHPGRRRSSTSARASATAPSTASSARRCSPTSTATAALEIVAAAMDRHVYAWHADGTPVAGWPVLVVDRAKVARDRPGRRTGHASSPASAPTTHQGAIVDTPGGRRPHGRRRARDRRRHQRGVRGGRSTPAASTRPSYAPLGAALAPGNGRLFAIKPTGGPADDLAGSTTTSTCAGWPFKVGILQRGLLPLVGEGITGSPVIGAVAVRGLRRRPARRHDPGGRAAPTCSTRTARSCYGQDATARTSPCRPSGGAGGRPGLPGRRRPSRLRDAGRRSRASWRPAAGVAARARRRAARVPGRPGLPRRLGPGDGPARAGLARRRSTTSSSSPARRSPTSTALPGRGGRRRHRARDLQGVHRRRRADRRRLAEADRRLDGRPTRRSGRGATAPTKVRRHAAPAAGGCIAYETGAGACAPADWPRSTTTRPTRATRAATRSSPGVPTEIAADAAPSVTFTAPGDDLLCGTAAALRGRRVGDGAVRGDGRRRRDPKAAGTAEALTLAGDAAYSPSARSTSRATSAAPRWSRASRRHADRRPPTATPRRRHGEPDADRDRHAGVHRHTRADRDTDRHGGHHRDRRPPTPPIVCAALPAVDRHARAAARAARAKVRGRPGRECARIDAGPRSRSAAASRAACRHVKANGRLARVRRCRDAIYFRAAGVSRSGAVKLQAARAAAAGTPSACAPSRDAVPGAPRACACA